MKTVQTFLSLLLVLAMSLCMTIPSMAVDTTRDEINGIQIGEPIEAVVERRGPVQKFSLTIPNDGLFHEVTKFAGEYSKNTELEIVSATWLPTFQKVDFEFRDEVNGGAQGFTLAAGDTRTVTLRTASYWGLYVRVSGKNAQSVSGEIYIEFN